MKGWILQHLSIIAIGCLVLLSIGLFGLGYYYSVSSRDVASFFYTFAGSILAAAITTTFLNFPDVTNYVSSAVAKLITSGSAVSLLNDDARDNLVKAAALRRLSDEIITIPDELYERLSMLTDSYLKGPYLSNYNYVTNIRTDDADSRFIMTESNIRYRIHIAHLRKKPIFFPIKYEFQWEVDAIGDTDGVVWVPKLLLRVGETTLHNGPFEVSESTDNGKLKVVASFSQVVELSEDCDVRIDAIARNTECDPVDAMFFRYPVKGFTGVLNSSGGRNFDALVFRSGISGERSLDCGEPSVFSSGVNFSCGSDWGLPGSGFVFTFPLSKQNVS